MSARSAAQQAPPSRAPEFPVSAPARSLVDSDGPVPLAAILDAARAAGATGLPSLPTVSAGWVWPAGVLWIAEVGDVPDPHALDQLFPSQDEARAAAYGVIDATRDRLVRRLRATGGVAAELATTRARWEPPILYVWDDIDQLLPSEQRVP